MYPRFYKPLLSHSFFLFGPRATGKTTWLKALFPQATYIDLLDSEIARQILASPSRLEGMLPKNTKKVIIDEVQKAPGVLDEVQRLMESRKLEFILTGSSARKLKKGAANLLAGRARQRFFYPLTIWELDKSFQLQKASRYGLLPNVWVESEPAEFLSTYVYAYLKEEVFAEGLTRNLGTFSRFLEMMSFSQGQPLNMTTIARDVGVDAKVIAHHIEILEDLLLAARLPVFTRRAKRRMTTHPKFFFFDSGVFRTLRPKGPLDVDSEMDGAALETLFFHHHRALGEFVGWDQHLYFWRTAQKHEVDFISYGSKGLFAFEIKRSSVARDEDFRGLREFQSDYPMAKCFMFYGGEREFTQHGVKVVNFEQGLRQLPEFFGVTIDPVKV